MYTPENIHASVGARARVLASLTTIFLLLLTSTVAFAQGAAEAVGARVRLSESGAKQEAQAPGKLAPAPVVRMKGGDASANLFVTEPSLVTATSYPFTNNTSVALEDMSSGTTQLVGANLDDNASPVTNIGFEFWFDGVRATQFSVNANGLLRLGSTIVSTGFTNSLATTTDAPKIGAFWDDMCTGTSGKIHYKVFGSAPNRKLVVEWQNMQITRNGACGGVGTGTFQVWLYESAHATLPGVIEFVYGSGLTTSQDGGYSVGMQSGVATNFASVTTSAPSVSYVTANNAQTSAITSGTKYTFTPNVPLAPTALNFTAVTPTSMTLNWTDNAANEAGYAIYQSTDGTNFTFVAQAAANATSQAVSGLSPSTNYFFKVYAVSEGALSSALNGSQMSAAPGVVNSTATGGNWSDTATWVGGVVPTSADNVTIADGATVTIDTAANALNLSVGTGGAPAILQYEATTARTLAVLLSVTVGSNGTFQSAATGTQTGHALSIGTNLTNNGIINFSTSANAAGAGLTFTGAANNTFGGSGTATLRQLTINKGAGAVTTASPVLDVTTTFTFGNTGAGFGVNTTTYNGILKISGSTAWSNVLFAGAAGYTIPSTGGLWLNNANFSVTGQNGSPSVSGLLRISQGTLNIGTASGNSMAFAAGSNIIVEGGAVNATGRFGVTAAATAFTYNQSGGTITVCTIGNTSTTLASFDMGTSATASININGGTIVVQLANTGGSGPRDYRHQAGATGTATVTGGTVQLGNAASGAAKAFSIAGVLPNLVINNASAGHSATFLAPVAFNNITLNITINTGTALNIGSNVFLMNGPTLTNNGTLTANGASSNFVWFLTTAPQLYTGSGNVTAPVTNFAVQSTQGLTIDPASSNIVVSAIRLFAGNVINSNKITLGNGGTTTGTVQIGNTTTPTAAGTFDVPFTFNLGTGGQIISYLRTGAIRSTGPEINPTRTITTLSVDPNGFNVNLVGDINVTGTMTLTTASFTIGANTLTLNNPIAGTPTHLKGDATSSLVLNGTTAINVPSSITALNNLTLNNTGGSTLQGALTIAGTLTLQNGALTIGANELAINGPLTVGAGTLTGGATSIISIGGSGATPTLPSVSGGLSRLTVNRTGGLTLGAPLAVNLTLELFAGSLNNATNNVTLGNNASIVVAGGSLAAAPIFGTTVNVVYLSGLPITTGPEIPVSPTVLNNLTVTGPGNVLLSFSPMINGTLNLNGGNIVTGGNAVVVRAGGAVSRTNGYVDGNLARTFIAPGTLTYDLGAGGAYSPVNVDAAALSLPQAVLTVRAVNSSVAGLPTGQSLQRHWAFSSSAITSATLQFAYAATDVPGTANEAQFRIIRKRSVDQRFTFPNGLTDNVDESLDTATTATDVTMPDRGGFYTLAQLDAPGAKAGDARSIELFDFDGGDARTDVAIWNPTSGDWNIINSITSATRTQVDWGRQSLGDRLVPGDYDGDTKTDLAVWREGDGNWYVVRSTTGTPLIQNWGQTGDKPVVGDFDGDGRTDLAVFREADGNWYVRNSGGAPPSTVRGWGTTGDKPVPADYDGDGKTDIAVFRSSDGNWYIINSSDNSTTVQNWGTSGDVLVPSDYDGDGRADIAVWRSSDGNWYIRNSSDASVSVRNWGGAGDRPVPGDYDRDGRTDIAIYRSSDSNFYIVRSSDGNVNTNLFSGSGDVPVASAPQQ